jgi:hypothetical protein
MFGKLLMVQRVFNVSLDSGHGGVTKNLDGDEDCFDEGFSHPPYVRPSPTDLWAAYTRNHSQTSSPGCWLTAGSALGEFTLFRTMYSSTL